MSRQARAACVAALGVFGLALGAMAAPGHAPVRYARPATSSLLSTASGDAYRAPESLRERVAAEAWQSARFGAAGADVAAARLAAARAAAISPVAPVPGKWRELGPDPYIVNDPIYGDPSSGLDRSAGRISALAVDPNDRTGRTVWAGAASGGVWVTRDGGRTWRPTGDGLPSMAIGALAIDARTKAIYAGTGDPATGGGNVFPGTGVYRSTNGGKTWYRAPKNVAGASTVYTIAMAGTRIFVATNKGLFRSVDKGNSYQDVRLPTNAAGTAPSASRLGSVVSDVVVQPGKPDVVTAVVGWRAGTSGNPNSEGNGLYRSTTGGAPGSFTRFAASTFGQPGRSDDPIGRVSLAYAEGPGQDHNVMWALIQDAGLFQGETFLGAPYALSSPLNGIYRSGDNGQTWMLKGTTESLVAAPGTGLASEFALYGPGVQSWYNSWIAVDPANQDVVLVGLEEIYQTAANANGPGLALWKTIGRYWNACAAPINVNCGANQQSPYSGTTTHPDQHSVAFARTNPIKLYVGNDGGVFSQPAGADGYSNASWTSHNRGLRTLQPYYAVMSSDGVAYAGLQDNGTLKVLPNGTGYEVYGGDGGDVAVEPDNSNNAYEEYVNGDIRRTSNGGSSWTSIAPALTAAQFITPFQMDPKNKNHLVMGAREVVETTRGIATNCSLDDPALREEPASELRACDWMISFDMGQITVNGGVVVDRTTSGLDLRGSDVYVAWCGVCDVLTAGAGVPARLNSGIATNVKPGCQPVPGRADCWHFARSRGLPKRYISDVAIDPSNRNTIFVTLNGYSRKWYTPDARTPGVGRGHVYVSTNAGESFRDISSGLPDVPANAVLVRGDRVYVGNDLGVWTAPKKGGAFQKLGTGFPTVPVTDLELNPQGTKLVVAAYGRGVWYYEFAKTTVRRSSAGTIRRSGRTDAAVGPDGADTVATGAQRALPPDTGTAPPTVAGVVLTLLAAGMLRRRSRTQ